MRTGKELFNTLPVELNEMGLPGMSSTLDEMYRSPKFLELDPLTAIANLVQPEYQKKMNNRIQSRLRQRPSAWMSAGTLQLRRFWRTGISAPWHYGNAVYAGLH